MKTLFTWTKHELTHLLGEDKLPSQDEFRGLKAKLINQQQAVTDILVKLSANMNVKKEDLQNEGLVSKKIETINKECNGTSK